MMRRFKRAFYHVCKWLGFFDVARVLTRRGLRILCYHGFSLSDEADFRPGLFIRSDTFLRRMQYLSRKAYKVLPLQEAYSRLEAGRLPSSSVVITIDDGFDSVARCAWPVLERFSFPATVYVTTYYVRKQNPVFRLVVQYMFWKTFKKQLDTNGLGLPLPPVLPLEPDEEKHKNIWKLILLGEGSLDETERCRLACQLGRRLGVDYASLEATRTLTLMSPEKIHALSVAGMDIQLHTHRHQLLEDEVFVRREILQNREVLEPLTGKTLNHFCYPSGIWSARHWPWLDALRITTATTCDPGLNYRDVPRLGLRRFLDGEDISQIEFEAELSGFSELLRSARSALRVSGALGGGE